MPSLARDHAIEIWSAGVAAVDSTQLVTSAVLIDDDTLHVSNQQFPLAKLRHIEVVGAGKAGAGMAQGLETTLAALPSTITVSGWINVPDDCVIPLQHLHLHAARPAGVNEPTPAGVQGANEILRRVARLQPHDLCIVLLSGGGSALLPAPVDGVPLEDKLTTTRLLASSGASIHELNQVRRGISRIKAGGLLRACRAKQLICLIISDVVGDPLDIIASGPTVVPADTDTSSSIDVLRRFDPQLERTPASVITALRQTQSPPAIGCTVTNQIIGNNATALRAAAEKADQLGYIVESHGSDNEGSAHSLGSRLFDRLTELRNNKSKEAVCVLAGGETTVKLCDMPGKGGRNQELVLAAISQHPSADDWKNISLLSGGTDGEDGPTSAAGAFADENLVRRVQSSSLLPSDYLTANDAWHFFQQADGLLTTGPTHTNVMDLQVGLVAPN